LLQIFNEEEFLKSGFLSDKIDQELMVAKEVIEDKLL
jgi:hypothetical protein